MLVRDFHLNQPVRKTGYIDEDTLHFPKDISCIIGLTKERINFLKKKGCPFFGRKTTIRWVRDFIAREAGVPLPFSKPLPNLSH